MVNDNQEQHKRCYTAADAADELLSSLSEKHKKHGYQATLNGKAMDLGYRFWEGPVRGQKGCVRLTLQTELVGGEVNFKEWHELELWKLDARASRAGPMKWEHTIIHKADMGRKKDTALQSRPRAGVHAQQPKKTTLKFCWEVKFPFN